MNDDEHEPAMAGENAVARLFEAADCDVSQAAGREPGSVDWFATPRKGLGRRRTYFRVWTRCPEDIDVALAELDDKRRATAADRALGVVMVGGLLPGYSADLEAGRCAVLTYRRLVLEVSGIADSVREHVLAYGARAEPALYLPRRVDDRERAYPDAVGWIKEWVRGRPTSPIILLSRHAADRSAVVEQVIYEIGARFVSEPDDTVLLSRQAPVGAASLAYALGFSVLVHEDIRLLHSHQPSLACLEYSAVKSYERSVRDYLPGKYVSLSTPSSIDVERWFEARLGSPALNARFLSAREREPEFRRLTDASANLRPMLDAVLDSRGVSSSGIAQWIAYVVHDYISTVLRGALRDETASPAQLVPLEDAALTQFSLGWISIEPGRQLVSHPARGPEREQILTWHEEGSHGRFQMNTLIRDYLIARRLAREILAGNVGSLSRHQFPREYVFLFLSILSPEAAARFAEGRGVEVRAEIEAEVERRLQLTLAHQLKRSVGAILMHVQHVRENLGAADVAKFDYEFRRIDEELAFQSALAEQTGRWQEVPNDPPEGLALHENVVDAAAPLRQKYPDVVCEIDVSVALAVRASRAGLREILHCLMENAFHAVASAPAPRVGIRATHEGDTVRLDIVDNGPGIRAEDRERIFEPYVTTKKGGDQPLGTGLGLAIARRYAARLGAYVGLDPECEGTCFFARFVTWRDAS
ncbi:two component sensor kinase [Sorangium cellulosum So ce56]|uniref:histidine kinase n=1 Tax=Sorangium cellulosum (strain So ce56) TaxID=448385 RepID=A9G2G4_SORC5|nr:HAMP domain-containing sensor histidine kinase [Sorangium cellulosum]CAN95647.1 two component sensor kinase [Sorangium cellulosum So ce56]